MKKHSLMITAAALAAAMVLGNGLCEKPAVETSETVTSQASAEETTKAPETTAKAPEQNRRLRQLEVYLVAPGHRYKGDSGWFGVHPSGGRRQGL